MHAVLIRSHVASDGGRARERTGDDKCGEGVDGRIAGHFCDLVGAAFDISAAQVKPAANTSNLQIFMLKIRCFILTSGTEIFSAPILID